MCLFILPPRLVMIVYDSACAASFTHLQSAVRNGQTSVTVNGFVLAVMITGKIFLTGYDKQTALWWTQMTHDVERMTDNERRTTGAGQRHGYGISSPQVS